MHSFHKEIASNSTMQIHFLGASQSSHGPSLLQMFHVQKHHFLLPPLFWRRLQEFAHRNQVQQITKTSRSGEAGAIKVCLSIKKTPWSIVFIWLVVYLPLWKIWVRQLGWLFPIYGTMKNVPNHQPVIVNGDLYRYMMIHPAKSIKQPKLLDVIRALNQLS